MPPQKNVTIHEIARHANVSISTVSRVMNDSAGVSEHKRQAVLAAIAELDYRPNPTAQGLASGQSKTVGVVTQFISSPHFSAMTSGIFTGFKDSGYSVLFADGSFDPKIEQRNVNSLLQRNVDGLILLSGGLSDADILALSEQTTLVVVGRDIPELAGQCLMLDQFVAAYDATRYLINMGHQRIAHIVGIPSHQDAMDRKRGYTQALQDAGVDIDPDLMIEGDFTERSGLLAVEMLLMRGKQFTAIFAGNDQMAGGARLALFRKGIRVPEDVSMIGFDDQASSAFMTPPLTTIRQPALAMGQTAAKMLLALLNDQPPPTVALQAELIIRESVARVG